MTSTRSTMVSPTSGHHQHTRYFGQVALVECRTRPVGSTRSGDDEGGESATSRAGSTGERVVVEVDNEFPERLQNAESWKETISWRVESPRGAIFWVITAGNVTHDKKARRKTLLASQFLLLPFSQPSTTPQLSPKTRKTWPGRLVSSRSK